MAIHPLAVVDPQAEVHPEAIVGPFCVVRGATRLGPGVELRNHATVYGRATIGSGTVIFPGAVVGSDPQDLKFKGEDSEVVIGERCRIHECVTISKGTAGGGMRTVIGDAVLVMAYAHIAHDCQIGDSVVIGNNAQLAGHVKIGRKAVIGGMVGIHHFATVGELTMLGSMCGVRFDVPPFVIADGNPAEPRTINLIGLRRDGYAEEDISQVKDAFRVLFHSRGNRTVGEAVAAVRASAPADPRHPVQRLCSWMNEHLEYAIKGRMLESFREPVVGGKPNQSSMNNNDAPASADADEETGSKATA
jgi:UDP-N-acetylglucosamine acyltransferase